MDKKRNEKSNKQITGNIGLFYTCYQLSKLGWNCLPTTRNAKGIDIIIYSQNAKRKYTIQVKSLSEINAVPMGKNKDIIADFLVIVVNVYKDKPDVFILTKEEAKEMIDPRHTEDKTSYWIQKDKYNSDEYKNKWDKIGRGDED
jgi:hypothetical protein